MIPAHYDDIGSFLRESRESLGESLADAARAIHIRQNYLAAIESGKLDELPGKAYARGYIKNYALYLGIDPTELLAAFDELVPASSGELFIPEPTMQENLPSRTLLMVAVAGGVLLLGYYFLFGREARIPVVRVKDVPAQLMLEAEAIRHPMVGKWQKCLNNHVDDCFVQLRQEETMNTLRTGYASAFTFLMQL